MIFLSMMYSGRFLVSSNMLPMYSPRIPMVNSCTPPRKTMVMMVEDQPGTIDSLPERYMTNTQMAKARAMKIDRVPSEMASLSGFLEKPKIPAEASENILRTEYLVFPAARSLRS